MRIPARLRDVLSAARTGDWLSVRRIGAYAAILFAFELVAILFLTAGTHGWVVPLDKPNTTDFVSFYAAGSLANNGTPEAVYLQPLHLAAEERITAAGITYVHFFYPPVFILLCALLARLPYLVAFAVFQLGTLIPLVMVAARILRRPVGAVLLPLLAFPAVFINIGCGQNAFLTAALFGAGTLLVDRKPVVAGLLFGALAYKPHFGLLIPLALTASGNWRAFGAAALSALGLVLLSALFYGTGTWDAFLAAIAGSHQTYESGRVDLAAFVTPFGAMLQFGAPPALAYLVQGIASIVAGGIVFHAWRSRCSLPLRAATLIAATLLAIPLALFYDLVLSAVAIAWLVRAGQLQGFLPWERSALVVVFIAPLLVRGVGTALYFPIGLLAVLVLLVLCVARLRQENVMKTKSEKPVGQLPDEMCGSAAFG